jgi:hypothetical protein
MRISSQSAGAVRKIIAAGEALAAREKGAKAKWVALMGEVREEFSNPKYVSEHKAQVCIDIAKLEGVQGTAQIEDRALDLMDHSIEEVMAMRDRLELRMRR